MAKTFKKVVAFETSDVTYWNPVQSGDSVEGVYTKKIEGVITKFGTMDYMEIVKATGETVRVGISSGLTRQIARLNLYDEVKIEYLGQAYNKTTKRRYNDFAVYRAEEE